MKITKLADKIYQSGWIDDANYLCATIPQPFGVVSLAIDRSIDVGGTSDLIKQRTFLLDYFREDSAEGLISTALLTGLVNMLEAYYDSGVSILVHCIAGQSRSSYLLAALISRVQNITCQEAIDLIFTLRPGAKENMQESFKQHLLEIGTFGNLPERTLLGSPVD